MAASRVTHNTGVALAAAAAVAAGVNAGVARAPVPDATDTATAAAQPGRGPQGRWVAAAVVAARIRWAAGLTTGRATAAALDTVCTGVGASLASQELGPAAFAILAAAPT